MSGDSSICAAISGRNVFKIGVSDHCIMIISGGYYYDNTYLTDYYNIRGASSSYGNYVDIDNENVCLMYYSSSDSGERWSCALEIIKDTTGYSCINTINKNTLFSGWSQVCINAGSSAATNGVDSILIIDF